MRLSRRIPARTKTLSARWCKKDFSKNTEKWRNIRRENPSCYWCRRGLNDGEDIALACFDGLGNKVLCQECADELIASDR